MNINEINPFVRFAEKRSFFAGYGSFVMAYDHRIFYVHSGKIYARTESGAYEIGKNKLIVFPPAYPYKLKFSGDVIFTVINFDVEYKYENVCALAPDTEEEFDRSRIISSKTCGEFPCLFSCDETADRLVEDILKFSVSKSLYAGGIASALLKLLLIKSAVYTSSEQMPPLIGDIMSYVDKNYSHDITNNVLGEIFSYHPNYINKLFKEYTGQSIHSYITNVRLEKSALLLTERNMSICEAAFACGFCTQAYYTKRFREKYGITPYKFKNKKHL